VAQTRRKRQTKHRGNAAGVVESRGRTGRKPTADEKSGKVNETRARAKKSQQEEREPTWRGAWVRAMFAAVMLLAILLIFKLTKPAQAIAVFPIVLVLYVPVSYYTERWTYNRKQRSKARAGSKAGLP
jgi:hypothetical protein